MEHSLWGTTMPGRRVRALVEQLQRFERGRFVGVREAGWTYRRISAHLGTCIGDVSLFSAVMCGMFPHPVGFSDESRFCMYANDERACVQRSPGERHLPECIRPRHTGPTSGFMLCGGISYNSRSHFGVSAWKIRQCPLHFIGC